LKPKLLCSEVFR